MHVIADTSEYRLLNYVSVAILVAAAIQNSAKYWSEWQDLNLRPPRPERGAQPVASLSRGVARFCVIPVKLCADFRRFRWFVAEHSDPRKLRKNQ
jgi:hypothetical protein